MRAFFFACLTLIPLAPAIRAEEKEIGFPPEEWLERFEFVAPEQDWNSVLRASADTLPSFSVIPAAPGTQLVRVSLPFPPGAFLITPGMEVGLAVKSGNVEIEPDVRVLTAHPARPLSVRRAIVTFPFNFPDLRKRHFDLKLIPEKKEPLNPQPEPFPFNGRVGETDLKVTDRTIEIATHGKPLYRAEWLAPDRQAPGGTDPIIPKVEIIERGQHFLWVRVMIPDRHWPRILEVRADSLGSVAVRGHLQRMIEGDGFAPNLGWRIEGPAAKLLPADQVVPGVRGGLVHLFKGGQPAWVEGTAGRIDFPDAHLLRRGDLDVVTNGERSDTRYVRCYEEERIPHQESGWRTAEFVISPPGVTPWTALLEPAQKCEIPPQAFNIAYQNGTDTDLSAWKELEGCRQYHRDIMAGCYSLGDDFGNISSMPASGPFGMNRLNHDPPIFHEYQRSSDPRLRETALLWCDNYHDLSLWWGRKKDGDFGGTRYNNVTAMNRTHEDDKNFMWRSNSAVHFCTKGFDAFLLAYEETGDPRMATALRWQIEYSKQKVHVDQGEARNVGIALDFMHVYELTGREDLRDEAMRLFRELRSKLSEGDLFSQGGAPIVKEMPFIDDDEIGYKYPFAKPYIIGYALEGLPELARYAPDEPKLRDVIRAVADFLAASQDPTGGWRYPHPRSSYVIVSQGLEHSAQIVRAAAYLESRGEPMENLLDAIETTLQGRVLAWKKTGQIFGGLAAWEKAPGILKEGQKIGDLYKTPEDRDRSRDYTEGNIGLGGGPPEGVVYFTEVLDFYLAHRPAERLFNANPDFRKVLDRMAEKKIEKENTPERKEVLNYGMEKRLPAFANARIERMKFPLAYDPNGISSFADWRVKARARLIECCFTPPPRSAFDPVVIATEDRGAYEARKIAFNVSADCRIPAYLLIPKSKGPFPAVIALHDHGAHFSIGKEKVIRPFGVAPEVLADAEEWVKSAYGGRFIGDELARRGYIVFSMDALFWGGRGRREGIDYKAQQELAANLLQLGMSWSGVITWDDMRSAEFVASLPEVDPARIGAVGLSMGCHRTWTLCAASDRIAAGAAICWMGTTNVLMAPGNNQTTGQSAFSMLMPGLRNDLDYPDVASIACPKPMLFFNGEQDTLFPVPGVEAAFARMRRVWESQHAEEKLITKLWRVPHEFNQAMQEEAFAWLDGILRPAQR